MNMKSGDREIVTVVPGEHRPYAETRPRGVRAPWGKITMLHVLVGAACNNNCIFCMESDRKGRQKHIESQTPDDIRRMIDAYPFKDEILFTSGEPTLNPELPGYIELAHKTGFKTIGLISNARRLSYMGYAARLARYGLNKVTVSIHGHTARLHESLTRTRGSFQQTVGGLGNLSILKDRTGLEIHTSTVVVRRNLPHVREIHDLLTSFGVDRMCFNVMMVRGGARRNSIC